MLACIYHLCNTDCVTRSCWATRQVLVAPRQRRSPPLEAPLETSHRHKQKAAHPSHPHQSGQRHPLPAHLSKPAWDRKARLCCPWQTATRLDIDVVGPVPREFERRRTDERFGLFGTFGKRSIYTHKLPHFKDRICHLCLDNTNRLPCSPKIDS